MDATRVLMCVLHKKKTTSKQLIFGLIQLDSGKKLVIAAFQWWNVCHQKYSIKIIWRMAESEWTMNFSLCHFESSEFDCGKFCSFRWFGELRWIIQLRYRWNACDGRIIRIEFNNIDKSTQCHNCLNSVRQPCWHFETFHFRLHIFPISSSSFDVLFRT